MSTIKKNISTFFYQKFGEVLNYFKHTCNTYNYIRARAQYKQLFPKFIHSHNLFSIDNGQLTIDNEIQPLYYQSILNFKP
jgi:hypothetical protein